MQRYLRISIGKNQTTIRDGTNYVATVHGNCNHVAVATMLSAAPDLLAACLLLGNWFAQCKMRSIHLMSIISETCSTCDKDIPVGSNLFLYHKNGVRLAWCSENCAVEMGATVPIMLKVNV